MLTRFTDALDLYGNVQMHMLAQGQSLARHLSKLAEEMHSKFVTQHRPAGVGPQAITGINTEALGDIRLSSCATSNPARPFS